MALFSSRKKELELREAESDGQSFWKEDFDPQSRTKILYILHEVAVKLGLEEYLTSVRYTILRDRGILTLSGLQNSMSDLTEFIMSGDCSDVIDVVESAFLAYPSLNNLGPFQRDDIERYLEKEINQLFREARISYIIQNGKVFEAPPKEMQELVYRPLLNLFLQQSSLAKVESAFKDSLEESSLHRYSDAVTDAATAIQEMFRVLGAGQDSISSQVRHLKNLGYFEGSDAPLIAALEKMFAWVGTVRSQKGDSHKVTQTSESEAKFFISIVGALLIRLAEMRESKGLDQPPSTFVI